jgi:DNA repair exonuclease SbcCD ATPase subunit
MRIQSVTVRNYRIHRELTVKLDDSRTLIGGPNECGKSTLVEAIHRALFLKSKVGGDTQKSMVSTAYPGAPEVELSFTAANEEYHLLKRFSGASGSTRLTEVGGQTWAGEEAEVRLTTLLKVEEIDGGRGVGNRVAQQWSHLWIWQGQSGDDPSEFANLQKDNLLQRLQQTGGAAALQSETDSKILAQFAAATEATFTQAGKPKTGSELEKAENSARTAEAERQSAGEKVGKLRQSVQDFADANQVITRATTDLEALRRQQDTAKDKLAQVAELLRKEETQAAEAKVAIDAYDTLKRYDDQIGKKREAIGELKNSLAPKNEETTRLTEARDSAHRQAVIASEEYDKATTHTRTVRLRRDLSVAFEGRFEKEARRAELQSKQEKVQAYQHELSTLRQNLAKLPEVDAAKLKKLNKLEKEILQSEAALQGMATGVELLAAEAPVQLGDLSLAVGQSRIVTEETEVAAGPSLRLRIRPGGGTSLLDARHSAQDAHQALTTVLDSLGIKSVAEASEAAARINEISGGIDRLEAALADLDAANLLQSFNEASEAATAAEAEVSRWLGQLPDFIQPKDLSMAKTQSAAEEKILDDAERAESRLKKGRDAAIKVQNSAEEVLSEHVLSIEKQNRRLNDLEVELRLLLETHGADEARVKALAAALSAKIQSETQLAGTRQLIADLQPDFLTTDLERLERAYKQTDQVSRDAESKRAVAQAALRLDGTDDPEAALVQAGARAQSAQDHLASVRRKADAMQLLHQLFLDQQRVLAEHFTQPLADKVSAYLQCLFGSGARAKVTLGNDGFAGLQFVRPSQGGGAVPFDSLSGGTREQVAAAVRLAMAEVLAADHNGCLPVVFDDAFAYSDPERVQILQRMLDLGASHKLQIIVLTCNPSDYAALGASQILLRAENTVTSPLPPAPSATSDPAPPSADVEASPVSVAVPATANEQRQQLIACLRELGGKAGNLTLRQSLGWDEVTYTTVKEGMIVSGALLPGRGRGGAVALRDTTFST